MKRWYRFRGLLLLVVAEMERTHTHEPSTVTLAAHARRGLIREAMANTRTRTVPVEGAIAAFHPEVKLGPCTSVLRIVLHDIIINSVYITSLYTIFRIALHQCKMCWNKVLTFGVGLIKVGFRAPPNRQHMK